MPKDAAEAVGIALAWFEVNSGWAPPNEDDLTEPEGWCEHGLASWHRVLAALD